MLNPPPKGAPLSGDDSINFKVQHAGTSKPEPESAAGPAAPAGPHIEYEYWDKKRGPAPPAGGGWESTEGGGFRKPKGAGGAKPPPVPEDAKKQAGDKKTPPKPPARLGKDTPQQDGTKAPETLQDSPDNHNGTKPSIFSTNRDDHKNTSVSEHYEAMAHAEGDPKLKDFHQQQVQEKTKEMTPQEHAALSDELKDKHAENPGLGLDKFVQQHEQKQTQQVLAETLADTAEKPPEVATPRNGVEQVKEAHNAAIASWEKKRDKHGAAVTKWESKKQAHEDKSAKEVGAAKAKVSESSRKLLEHRSKKPIAPEVVKKPRAQDFPQHDGKIPTAVQEKYDKYKAEKDTHDSVHSKWKNEGIALTNEHNKNRAEHSSVKDAQKPFTEKQPEFKEAKPDKKKMREQLTVRKKAQKTMTDEDLKMDRDIRSAKVKSDKAAKKAKEAADKSKEADLKVADTATAKRNRKVLATEARKTEQEAKTADKEEDGFIKDFEKKKEKKKADADKQVVKDKKDADKKAIKDKEKADKKAVKDKAEEDKKAEKDKANKPRAAVNTIDHAVSLGHKTKAQDLQAKLKSHLDSGQLSPDDQKKLQTVHDALDEHANMSQVPGNDHKGQLKELLKVADKHGKKAYDPQDKTHQKPEKQEKAPAAGKLNAMNGLKSGIATGQSVGSAANAEAGAGNLAGGVVTGVPKGAVSMGHYLLKDKPKKTEQTKPKEPGQSSLERK